MTPISVNVSEVKAFLKDYQENAQIEILESGSKEKTELLKIAKARGYNLSDNTDLAGFKCIYAWADRPNNNGAILPEKPFLKALPTMIGKPINIGHNRTMVIGHIIDYSYQQKTKKAIMYGVIYKSNFNKEWEKAKKDFKANKLNVSFEIWSPKNKREYLANGTYKLFDQEIAGCALLFRNDEPAFDGAKVLALAKKMEESDSELVFASKYNEEELIIADMDKPVQLLQQSKIICCNCNSSFEAFEASEIKCPSCLAIVNKEGNMIYPPQKKDFQIMCPDCNSSHWKILARTNETATIQCLNESICGNNFKVTWSKEITKDKNPSFHYLYIGTKTCLQCGKRNEVLGTSEVSTKKVKCVKCGLEFSYDIKGQRIYKKIEKIEKLEISKIEQKGGIVMKKEEIKKDEVSLEKPEAKENQQKENKVEVIEVKKEIKPEAKVKKATKEQKDEAKVKTPLVAKKEVKVEKYPKTKALRIAIKKINDLTKELESAKADREEVLKSGINKVAKQLIEAKKQVKFYNDNAKEVLTRHTKLGDYNISDEDILNDDKFAMAKLELENAKLKNENLNSNDIVGVKKSNTDEYYEKHRKDINEKAFGNK